MNWFTKKPTTKVLNTNYILYFNEPVENTTEYYGYTSAKKAEEFNSLEKAQESAKYWARYYKIYIGKVTPILEYENTITEVNV
jgi:hypothetical protein